MSDDKIQKAMKNAIGNNKIEGYDVLDEEKELISHVIKKYHGEYGKQAIHSLLYGVVHGVSEIEKENGYGKHKK